MASGHAPTDERLVPGEQMWFVAPHEGEETLAFTSGRARRDPRMLRQANPSLPPVTQTDCYKRFFMEITEFGLNYAYHMQTQPEKDNFNFRYTHTEKPKHVIIVGAGMSGLCAAYELAQVGHTVTIIEKQSRVGGRVKTLSEPHFSKGLWADSGAMRAPGTGSPDWKGPKHFLTDWYTNLFQLECIPFINYSKEGFCCFYGQPKIRIEDWKKDPGKYCSQFWPGWDAKLTPETKAEMQITDIITTVQPHLGVMSCDPQPIRIADLPGLVEGVHANVGMGHRFLHHIERIKLLLYVVDVGGFQLSPNHPHRDALQTVSFFARDNYSSLVPSRRHAGESLGTRLQLFMVYCADKRFNLNLFALKPEMVKTGDMGILMRGCVPYDGHVYKIHKLVDSKDGCGTLWQYLLLRLHTP